MLSAFNFYSSCQSINRIFKSFIYNQTSFSSFLLHFKQILGPLFYCASFDWLGIQIIPSQVGTIFSTNYLLFTSKQTSHFPCILHISCWLLSSIIQILLTLTLASVMANTNLILRAAWVCGPKFQVSY